jgi:hypothetical protein
MLTLVIKNQTPNIACRGELGSVPVIFNVYLNMIKYWCHIKTKTKTKQTQ